MNTKVSSKYQIVIPKDIRRKINIQPGQKFDVSTTKDGRIILEKQASSDIDAYIKKYAGTLKAQDTAWGRENMDSVAWVRKIRDEWDR